MSGELLDRRPAFPESRLTGRGQVRFLMPIAARPHSPIGRGSGLKIRTVSVRVRLGAPMNFQFSVAS